MAQWILLASLLCTTGLMGNAAGAPRNLEGLPTQSSAAGNPNEHPNEELELESLKGKAGASAANGIKLSPGSGSADGKDSVASPPTPKPQMTSKPLVNMEHPAPSDNDNENSERYQAKLPILSFSLEDKRKEMGKSSGLVAEQPDYTPQDIAEYIFWTGDEKGVALALNDFVQDDLVSKNDVLKFLENVKFELDALRNRYTAVTQMNPGANFPSFSPSQNAKSLLQKTRFFNDIPTKRDLPGDYMGDFSNYDGWTTPENQKYNTPTQFMSVKADRIPPASSSTEDLPDYEEMIEKIRQADAKFREYSLEGIIYQLAKELFSQELHEQPQRSIQRFAHFVENEAELGRIPKDLGKAILDTLVGALVDAVGEQSGTGTKSGTQTASDNALKSKFPAGKNKNGN